jgi:hypothetical protein
LSNEAAGFHGAFRWRGTHVAAGFHGAFRWRGTHVAACWARAAADGNLARGRGPGREQTARVNADSFREGLAKAGFVEGRNVRIEERWANGDYQALPALAAELVAKGVVAIAATGDVTSARAAQGASGTVPVVFTIGADPVRFGLVASLNRPGGHVTGVSLLSSARSEAHRASAPARPQGFPHRAADESKQP